MPTTTTTARARRALATLVALAALVVGSAAPASAAPASNQPSDSRYQPGPSRPPAAQVCTHPYEGTFVKSKGYPKKLEIDLQCSNWGKFWRVEANDSEVSLKLKPAEHDYVYASYEYSTYDLEWFMWTTSSNTLYVYQVLTYQGSTYTSDFTMTRV